MTTYWIRTDPTKPIPARTPEPRVLDWAPRRTRATMQIGEAGSDFLTGWRPTRAAADLLVFGASIYCADKTTRRSRTTDAWTRTIELDMPVSAPDTWRDADFDGVLSFLTGDHWRIRPRSSTTHPLADVAGVPGAQPGKGSSSKTPGGVAADFDAPVGLGVDGVCLLSGGLDSLCGVIDLLESDPDRKLSLVSHHDGGQASTAQQSILAALVAEYGSDRIVPRRLYLRPAPANQHQERPLPTSRENTTRSRSLLFLSAALAMASAHGPEVPVYVPENGFIGINVPLTKARVGSASTRTTHPHFLAELAVATSAVGIPNPIINPYRHRTKGEMLVESLRPKLLKKLAPLSISCSHPEAARYAGKPQGNCGYCFPCLIRRSSLHQAGWDNHRYAWDVFDDQHLAELLDTRSSRGADLRAVIQSLNTDRPDRDVLLNGPLPTGEHEAFIGVWRRGQTELRAWLRRDRRRDVAALVSV